jgi:hypothetical protein
MTTRIEHNGVGKSEVGKRQKYKYKLNETVAFSEFICVEGVGVLVTQLYRIV